MVKPIQKALKALKAKRDAGELETVRLNPTDRCIANPESLMYTINAKCFECVGLGEDEFTRKTIGTCSAWTCPLWPHRPHQKLAPENFGKTERANAIAQHTKRGLLTTAAKNPTSRRKAVYAKCAECMDEDAQLIIHCKSKFPTQTDKACKGCPLWPRRTRPINLGLASIGFKSPRE